MEPLSVIGLATSCASLATQIFKVKTALGTLHDKFTSSQLAISALITQLSALEASATELESLLTLREPTLGQGEHLLHALDQSLSCCREVILYLSDHISYAITSHEAGLGLGRWLRAKYILDEDRLTPMKETLRDQIQAIQLLLAVVPLRTADERQAVLDDTHSVTLLQKTADDSSSLLLLQDVSPRSSLFSVQTDTLSRLSIMFTFDGALMDSRPYRAAVTTAWKRLRARHKDRFSGDAPIHPHRDRHVSMLPEKPLLSELSHSWQLRPIKSTLIMIVRWDFEAAGEVEMDCKAGEILIPMAIPENDDWIYVKGVSRTGFGMVPLAWLSVISRTGQKYDTKEEALRELREIGILKLSDLLALQRKYREGCLSLGRLPDSPRGKSGQ